MAGEGQQRKERERLKLFSQTHVCKAGGEDHSSKHPHAAFGSKHMAARVSLWQGDAHRQSMIHTFAKCEESGACVEVL